MKQISQTRKIFETIYSADSYTDETPEMMSLVQIDTYIWQAILLVIMQNRYLIFYIRYLRYHLRYLI